MSLVKLIVINSWGMLFPLWGINSEDGWIFQGLDFSLKSTNIMAFPFLSLKKGKDIAMCWCVHVNYVYICMSSCLLPPAQWVKKYSEKLYELQRECGLCIWPICKYGLHLGWDHCAQCAQTCMGRFCEGPPPSVRRHLPYYCIFTRQGKEIISLYLL